MVTPIDPQMCLHTGRILTEWFENPEYTDEDIKKQAMTLHPQVEGEPQCAFTQAKMMNFIGAKKKAKWAGNMSKQEVAMRLNEASKIVSPDNAKFLDKETTERTGLELNPLWQMEVIVRSGVLGPKDQIAALKELAGFTHSKAPSLNKVENTNATPEDWLMELARDQYQTITVPKVFQAREKGSSPESERNRLRRMAEVNALSNFSAIELAKIEEDFDGDEVWEEPE